MNIQKALDKGKGKVSIKGWVYRIRKGKNLIFIIIRDTNNLVQCIVEKEKVSEQIWQDADKLQVESAIEIDGDIQEDKRAATGYEIKTSKLNIVHLAENFPIGKDQSDDLLLDMRHLALRTRKLTSTLKIRSTVMGALHNIIREKGYIEVEAPTFNATTSEGGSSTFEVKYYGKKAYLTQSWQFYAENIINAFEKAYTMAPSFRAEKSRTSRHLTEFWHFEIEAAWATVQDMLKISEDCIIGTINQVIKDNKQELKVLGIDIKELEKVKAPFPTITYKAAIERLQKKGYKIKYGEDFGAKEEKYLAKEYKGNFLAVTNYPLEILKFYHGEDPKMPGTGMNFNILAPGIGEVLDSSQREPDLGKIQERLKKAKVDLSHSDWYLDSRRYGSVPHAGFGLGTERLIQWICKLETIKDAIPFPRTPTRIKP
tara:strand:- start:23 stop:1303 length:1281 start_codon:yes stop_codon:yes gene_type:complete